MIPTSGSCPTPAPWVPSIFPHVPCLDVSSRSVKGEAALGSSSDLSSVFLPAHPSQIPLVSILPLTLRKLFWLACAPGHLLPSGWPPSAPAAMPMSCRCYRSITFGAGLLRPLHLCWGLSLPSLRPFPLAGPLSLSLLLQTWL